MKIKGSDIIAFANIKGKWKAFAASLSVELDIKADVITVSNPFSGKWVKRKKKRMTWSGSSQCLLLNKTQPADIKELVMSWTPIKILICDVNKHDGTANYIADGRYRFEGDAFITRATSTANKRSLSTISMEFQGNGKPVWHSYQDVSMIEDKILHDNQKLEYNVY